MMLIKLGGDPMEVQRFGYTGPTPVAPFVAEYLQVFRIDGGGWRFVIRTQEDQHVQIVVPDWAASELGKVLK